MYKTGISQHIALEFWVLAEIQLKKGVLLHRLPYAYDNLVFSAIE